MKVSQRSVETTTKVDVSTWTAANTYATNQTIRLILNYINERGLDTNRITEGRDSIERALFTWLTSRHLKAVIIEVYDPETDSVKERFDVPFEYTPPKDADEETVQQVQKQQFESLQDEILKQIRRMDAPPSGCVYRIVARLKDENDEGQSPPKVRGWSPTSLRDTGKLDRKKLGKWLDAGSIEGSAAIWLLKKSGGEP